jgi:hypothetical protein
MIRLQSIAKWALGAGITLIIICLCLLWYINSEVRHLSGEKTTVVDPSQLETLFGKIAITGVKLLSPDSAYMLPDQTVLISENTIKSVGKDIAIPNDYRIMDASGKYLIPGLIDTHIHPYKSKNDLLLYLANGITHVAMMSSWQGLYLDWRKEAQDGALSPQIYVAAGPMNTAKDFRSKVRSLFGPIRLFNEPSKTKKAVSAFKEQGYDALKAYSLDKENYFAVAEEAKAQNIPMVGHLTPAVTLEDLYRSGQSQVAHVEEITKAVERAFGGRSKIYYDSTEAYLTYLKNNADRIAMKLKENNIAVSTTIGVYPSAKQQDLNLPEYLKSIELAYVNPGILEGSVFSPGWLPGSNRYENPNNTEPEGVRLAELYWNTYIEAANIMTLALARNGVTITAGTDAGNPGIVPGFSLHDELESLRDIGLSNAQVLHSATVAAADWLGSNAGKIEAGRRADLLLLDKNPLEDIRNTRSIHAVVANGKYLDQVQLDRILQSIKEANSESRTVRVDEYID